MFSLLNDCQFNMEKAIQTLPEEFRYLVNVEHSTKTARGLIVNVLDNDYNVIKEGLLYENGCTIEKLIACLKFEKFINDLEEKYKLLIFDERRIDNFEFYTDNLEKNGFEGYGYEFRIYDPEDEYKYESINVPLLLGDEISNYRSWYKNSLPKLKKEFNQ